MSSEISTPSSKRKIKIHKKSTAAVEFDEKYCDELLKFFDVPAFKVTEVLKKDGSIALIETAAELPTFAAFARFIGVTQKTLIRWESEHAGFYEAAQKARDLQCDILIQNSLRGNYASSFAMFTAKNILGWKDGEKGTASAEKPLLVKWEN